MDYRSVQTCLISLKTGMTMGEVDPGILRVSPLEQVGRRYWFQLTLIGMEARLERMSHSSLMALCHSG